MSIISAYKKGWSDLFRLKKMWLLLYVLNLMFALVVAMPLNGLLKLSVGNSLKLNRSIDAFDYTMASDFLNHFGHAFNGILDQSVFVALLFIIVSVFLTGGIIYLLVSQVRFEFSNFFKGAGKFFWRYLFISILFLFVHGIILFVFFRIFSSSGLNPLQMNSDAALLGKLMWLFPLYLFFAYLVFMIHDFVKIEIASSDITFFKSLLNGIKKVFRNFLKYLGLYLMNLIVAAVLIAVFIYLRKSIGMRYFWAGLLVSQLFVFIRIGLRVVRYGSAVSIANRN